MREIRKEVLVVGAGPVGLWTALVLAEAGVELKIIDSQNRTTARSYACALHPRTLAALDHLGLAHGLVEQGRKVETIAFYSGETRQAEINFSKLKAKFPYLLIVPQAVLEGALEQRLRKTGVHVDWNHRLDSISPQPEAVSVSVEELKGTSTGYIVPHWETVVAGQIPIRAQFVIGADGHNSITRQRANLNYRKLSAADAFAAYEFESEESPGTEVRVVMGEKTTDVLWPLPGDKWRWTFQVLRSEGPTEFPEKERRAIHLANKAVDDRLRDYVQSVASRRAPWFKAKVKEVTWCTQVIFEQGIVERFGVDRCWLAGDAAHQTGPVGVQSMNAGMAEGEMLANAMREIIHGQGEMELLDQYNRTSSSRWNSLLGMTPLKPDQKTSPWVAQHLARLIPCVPGLDEDFINLAAQIGIRP